VNNKLWFQSCVFLLGFLPVLVVASTGFTEASTAFKHGDTEKALQLFLALEKQSQTPTPQITLNIGLLYFKSANYVRAQEYLTRLSKQPNWAMLAQYYLGLLALRDGDKIKAKSLFTRVASQANNPTLREKSRAALGKVSGHLSLGAGESNVKAHLPTAPSYYLSYSAGFEDNVLALPSDQLDSTLQADDHYHELFVLAEMSVNDDLALNGYVSATYYDQYSDLNSNILDLGLEYEFSMFVSRPLATFNISQVSADGAAIYDQWQTKISSPLVILEYSLDASFSVQQILASTAFQFLDGFQYKLVLNKDWSIAGHTLALDYGYEINNRADLASENEFSSFSPRRHKLALSDEFNWSDQLEFTASLGVTHAQWRGTNDTLDELDNIHTAKRQADQFEYAFSAAYHLSKDMTLTTRYQYLDHDENINTNRYTNSQLSLTFSYEG